MNRSKDIGLLILRVSTGILLLFHGMHKLFNGIGFIKDRLVEEGIPEWLAYGVFIGEIIAPVLLVVGLRARIAAGLVVINMLWAIYLMQLGNLYQLKDTGAWAVELPALFLFASLSLIFLGGGKYAVSHNKTGD